MSNDTIPFSASFTPELSDVLAVIETRLVSHGGNVTVVIDGPSGAGKSTIADFLVANWPSTSQPVQLVRMDDIYAGWDGLEAAAAVAETILIAKDSGEYARWQQYDWQTGELTHWHGVDPHRPLIVEGCGSLGPDTARTANFRIWVSVADDIRRERALSRGGEDFESHWDARDAQFQARLRRENPKRFANMILAAN